MTPNESNKMLSDSNELDLMNKLKKIGADQDQMSLSSSSVECLENQDDPIQLNNLEHDLDLPNQPHSSSHTSNSLTSSSSSSCSLFENNTNQLNPLDIEQIDLKSADLNEDEKDCYKSENQPNSRCSDMDPNNSFGFANTIGALKKPITFASISKSKSANSSPSVISYTNPSKFLVGSGGGANGFTGSKVDSIRSEFFQNVKNLQFVLSQVRHLGESKMVKEWEILDIWTRSVREHSKNDFVIFLG
jgi:hypothetical protein